MPACYRCFERSFGPQRDYCRRILHSGDWDCTISPRQNFWSALFASVLLGLGTALAYPTLLAAVSDYVHPLYRASAVGVYRLWRGEWLKRWWKEIFDHVLWAQVCIFSDSAYSDSAENRRRFSLLYFDV